MGKVKSGLFRKEIRRTKQRRETELGKMEMGRQMAWTRRKLSIVKSEWHASHLGQSILS